MESLMDKITKQLMELDQKNALVDEGVRKLENAAQQVLNFRVEQRKIQEEHRDESAATKRANGAKSQKLEQLEWKLTKMAENEQKMEQELTKLGDTIHKKTEEQSLERHQKLMASRGELEERILKQLPTNAQFV